MHYLIFIISCIALAFPVAAQESKEEYKSVEESVYERVQAVRDESFWSLSAENDLFGGGTDQYYTSGIKLTYFDVNTDVPPIIDTIANAIPTFGINYTTSTYFTLGQSLFTPDDIEVRALQPDDRPYAAFLYGSVGLASAKDNHLDDVELTLGVVGPAAFGEPTQKFIHDKISRSPEPLGWDNQLKNEPGVILSFSRRWPIWAKVDAGPVQLRVEPQMNVSLGNIYTYAGTGASVTLGARNSQLQDTPPRVRPATPGTGYFDSPDDAFSWFLFAGVDGRAVGRNIFLDGNSFTGSHDVDKKNFVGDANVGFAITYDDVRLAYTLNYRTKEFDTQENEAIFGSLTVSTRF